VSLLSNKSLTINGSPAPPAKIVVAIGLKKPVASPKKEKEQDENVNRQNSPQQQYKEIIEDKPADKSVVEFEQDEVSFEFSSLPRPEVSGLDEDLLNLNSAPNPF